jgi:cytochrome P450
MPEATASRLEIGFADYNPFDEGFVRDPFPVFERLLAQYPVAFHTGLNAWFVTPHDLAAEVLRSPRFSTNFADWKGAPPRKPQAEWNLCDRMQAHSMATVAPAEHLRLRRLTAPAFSRRVMGLIEDRIRDAITGIFDEIEDPSEFNVATQIAAKAPIRAIARMVGVPPSAEELFEHGLGWNLVRAQNPMYSPEDREKFTQDALPGLQYLLDTVEERRRLADPGDDFIGTLIKASEADDRLDDMEILSVITALVAAGADTAVDLHTLAIYALLSHPEQRRLLRERPDLMEGAILEILRWSGHGKLGAIPRYPLEDVEINGQVLEKGSFVYTLFSTAWLDPAKWPQPRRFDITRNHAGNIIFGAGPHLCIGLNLVKVQGKLMIEEFERRFGDTARLAGDAGDIEYDPMHFNARRMTRLMVTTRA